MDLPSAKINIIKFTVFEDNNRKIATTTAMNINPRTKLVALKYNFFNSQINGSSVITLTNININLQKDDVFTEGLAHQKFIDISKLLCRW